MCTPGPGLFNLVYTWHVFGCFHAGGFMSGGTIGLHRLHSGKDCKQNLNQELMTGGRPPKREMKGKPRAHLVSWCSNQNYAYLGVISDPWSSSRCGVEFGCSCGLHLGACNLFMGRLLVTGTMPVKLMQVPYPIVPIKSSGPTFPWVRSQRSSPTIAGLGLGSRKRPSLCLIQFVFDGRQFISICSPYGTAALVDDHKSPSSWGKSSRMTFIIIDLIFSRGTGGWVNIHLDGAQDQRSFQTFSPAILNDRSSGISVEKTLLFL